MARSRIRAAWFRLLGRTLNRLTLRLARAGRGPFTVVRHRGRRSGRTCETPIIVAALGRDFVIELTYGDRVQWYRNVVAARGCELIRGGRLRDGAATRGVLPAPRTRAIVSSVRRRASGSG